MISLFFFSFILESSYLPPVWMVSSELESWTLFRLSACSSFPFSKAWNVLLSHFKSSPPQECARVSERHAAFSAGYFGTEYDKTWWDSISSLCPLSARWSFETLKFFWSYFTNIHFPMAWGSGFDVSSNLFLRIYICGWNFKSGSNILFSIFFFLTGNK